MAFDDVIGMMDLYFLILFKEAYELGLVDKRTYFNAVKMGLVKLNIPIKEENSNAI